MAPFNAPHMLGLLLATVAIAYAEDATCIHDEGLDEIHEVSLLQKELRLGMSAQPGDLEAFTAYIAKYDRTYASDEQEYAQRRALYEQRLEQAQRQNRQQHRRWNAAVNHLSDRTEAELLQLRGLRVVKTNRRSWRTTGMIGAQQTGLAFNQISSFVVPKEKSWTHLETAKKETNQAACGSCWALAAATMLQANAEINGYNRTFSPQALVNCVPNPHNCGGSGGCQGSTVELAMNWVMEKGLATWEDVPYLARNARCEMKRDKDLMVDVTLTGDNGNGNTALLSHKGHELDDMVAVGYHVAESRHSAGVALGLKGWERLPENEYEPLIRAVAQTGPVAVSVAAGTWHAYGAGVFDFCGKDAVVDHAVVLIGYGIDKVRNEKYWLIKNSWGSTWGENGKIRLLRQEGNVHCGTDRQPEAGTACDDGPSEVKVCGMCGILYDSVVAHFLPPRT